MDPMSLLLTQRNEILEACVQSAWDPCRFSWEKRASLYSRGQEIDALSLKGTDFFFAFDHGAEETWIGYYAPASDRVVGKTPPAAWGTLQGWFRRWLGLLQAQVTAPDLWSALEREAELVAGVGRDQGENDPFTADEIKQLSERIEEVRRYLLDSGAAEAAKRDTINGKLDYLKEAIQRLGRFDWRQAAFGVFVQLGIDVLTRDQSIAQFVGFTLGVVLGHPTHHGLIG